MLRQISIAAAIAFAAVICVGSLQHVSTAQESPNPSAISDRKILYYRNPMGLPDVSPVPKKDSMGMDYIPVYEDQAGGQDGSITLSPEKIQRTGIRTEPVEMRALSRTVRGAGMVMPDESRLSVVAVKFNGFIEDLLVPISGVTIHAGQPLVKVWIESPEILTRQADYLTAIKGSNPRAVATAEQNLEQFGIPSEVIAQIRVLDTPTRSITLNAPITGTVIDKPAVSGMGFMAGDALYRIADLSQIWVIVNIAEQDMGLMRAGQAASLTLPAFPGEMLTAKVEFVYPEIDQSTRTGRIRVALPNPDGRLKIGYFSDVYFDVPVGEGPVLAAPRSSIIDDGTRRVVFVAKENGRFVPTPITLGERAGNYVEIRGGIEAGERVVVRGNFLIDAESNLRAALAAFGTSEAAP